MPRFYFHFRVGDHLEVDEVGVELADQSEAVRQARHGARDLLDEAIADGRISSEGIVEITDENGFVVARVPLTPSDGIKANGMICAPPSPRLR